jgi:hypothetical protein
VSAKVVNVPMSGTVEVEYNAFTNPLPMNGSPTTDAEAFEQSLQRITAYVPPRFYCALFDQYGTPYGLTSLLLSTTANMLIFDDGQFDTAVAGDIITMDTVSNTFQGNSADVAASWDAFQADASGIVYGSYDLAYPWVR